MKIVADENIPFVKECFSSIGEVKGFAGQDITADIVKDADVLLVRSVTPVNSELLGGSNIKFVGTATIGFDHVDVEYLSERGIGFASAPGSNANSVAEYVVAGLLKLGEKYNFELAGRSVGIVGVGNVGSKAEAKARGLGMEVVLNDPPLLRQTGNGKYRPIEEIFDCDIVTLHTPLTYEGVDKTFHLADEEFFRSLKKGCIFINTSRGAVVDTAALRSAIECGKLKGAILDVWEDEPDIDTGLLELVDIGTSHIAGYAYDGKVAGMMMIYRAVCEYFGREAKFDAGSFLPAAEVAELTIKPKAAAERVVQAAVEKIYDIADDDARLRGILKEAKEDRGKFFSSLRKNYPVRREFGNTRIILEGGDEAIAGKLAATGFKL